MPIISSEITSQVRQAGGEWSVTERHIDHRGLAHSIVYFCPADLDPTEIMNARAARLGAEIDRRIAIDAEAMNFEVPVLWAEFLDRLTPQERIAIRTARSADPIVDDFLDLGERRGHLYLSSPRLAEALDYMAAKLDPEGNPLLAAGRKAEVLAP